MTDPKPLTREERVEYSQTGGDLACWGPEDIAYVLACYEATIQQAEARIAELERDCSTLRKEHADAMRAMVVLKASEAKLIAAVRALHRLYVCRGDDPPMPPYCAMEEPVDGTWCVTGQTESTFEDHDHFACSMAEVEARALADALNALPPEVFE